MLGEIILFQWEFELLKLRVELDEQGEEISEKCYGEIGALLTLMILYSKLFYLGGA